MIEEKLEIVLITYNRSSDLDNTLKEILESPFSKCKITILDNCSSDETPAVCSKYKKLYSNMKVIRHPKNIGGNANILRAVETSKSTYTWILCDDDHYNFSDCDDVLNAINSNRFDLISIGAPGQFEWEKGLKTSSKELVDCGSKYFHVFTFVPGFIFKTDLFDSLCVHEGYNKINDTYPHFPFINKSFEENFSIFTSKEDIIIRGTHNEPGFSSLTWFKSWLNCCYMIKNKTVRKNTIYESSSVPSFIKRIVYFIVSEKINNNDHKIMLDFLSSFISAFGFSRDLLLLFIIIPLLLIPPFCYKILLRIFLFLNHHVIKKGVYKHSLKMEEDDPFRRW